MAKLPKGKPEIEGLEEIVPEHAPKDPFLAELARIAKRQNKIAQPLYKHYSVKRGLRNADSTGVLVGLTEIGDVHGYIVSENEKVPVEGKLRYRGIEIEDIVAGFLKEKRHGFEETAYLLLFGELPGRDYLKNFCEFLGRNRRLPEGFTENMILKAPSSDIMNKLARSVLAQYSYDKSPEDRSMKNILRQCIRLIARFPVLAAYGYQAKAHYYDGYSLFLHSPSEKLSTAENFLRLIRPDKKYTRTEAELLDLCLVLHAEHGGGNNSSFVTHVVTSTDTDVYSSITAAIGSLKGLKHGGANIQVIKMMDNIKRHVKNYSDEGQIADYLTKIIRREAFDRTGLVYGIGHAVYTVSDPRAVILKKQAARLAKEKNLENEFDLYATIERMAPEVFRKVRNSNKVMSANVDFYSGFVYRMLGIPVELYTPIFAVSRIAGWCAHILEEHVSGGRIMRPAYKNVAEKRGYIPLLKR
ncbi:MAG: citrate/2-methylcitrate synthase [Sedimentisphaerales bacterium]|nr:citrate/2-methylcitrate synthase [Sedimentisphaerales bacterium]